ncbi:Ni,Fe-hydrogenase maturation factor (hyh operon) [Candidatus Sulfopaludibacter sp. SbA6]|nr:Ni,Fe-hydrogenase maturation factor (hyh operon) [Candidatus Sulfopaludibacter sp. SbA6]
MKPLLVIGLGNPLMGDDGIGWHIVARLAGDPRLPETVEVTSGGTDLLRHADQIEGRSRVVVIDAIQDAIEGNGQVGQISILDEDQLDERQQHAHHLSAVQAIGLLQLITPVRFTLLGISISSAAVANQLSPALAARMPAILDRVLQELMCTSSK